MKYMYCPKCEKNYVVKDNDYVCRQCGKRLIESTNNPTAATEHNNIENRANNNQMQENAQSSNILPISTRAYKSNLTVNNQLQENTISTNFSQRIPREKTEGEKCWIAIGIIVGVILVVVGIANMTAIEDANFGADYYTYSYRILANGVRAFYGLYVIIGICLVIKYGHEACKK